MFEYDDLVETFTELVRRASTQLPADVRAALKRGRDREQDDSLALKALDTIAENVELAAENSAPICQDTGTPVVWISYPVGVSTRMLAKAFTAAVEKATERKYLRPNAVDTLSGRNTGTGTGRGIPFIHFHEWDDQALDVRMILKGGGSENVGTQYKLPEPRLEAGRDLEGVRRVVLDAVVEAQGKGCAPGILGVCIGGDRVSGAEKAKEQILRPLEDSNEIPELAELEERLLREGNELGIGPMGFGGKTTLMGVKIGVLDRLPACYFVSVTYMCWADRRAAVRVDGSGDVTWLN
jgi:fumarate hydratase class I